VEIDWESQKECVWKLKILVDVDETTILTFSDVIEPTNPNRAIASCVDWMNEKLPAMQKSLSIDGAINGVLDAIDTAFDTIDDVISTVNIASATFLKAAYAIDNFESATFAELQRLRAGVNQFKTAVIILENTFESTIIDALIFSREAYDDIAWLTAQSDARIQTTTVLGHLAEVDASCDRAIRGKVGTTYTALPGDTWESISTAVYGDPTGANKLRQSNGIKYGDKPVPGMIYQVPT